MAAPELRIELESPDRSLARCRVCGFAEVRTDEVAHRGVLLLAECPRCEHRWTQAAAPPQVPQRARAIPMRSVRPSPLGDEEPAAAA